MADLHFFPITSYQPDDLADIGGDHIPILEAAFIKPKHQDASKPEHKTITEKVHDKYVTLLDWNFRHPWFTMVAGILSIVVGVLLATQVKFRMMPVAERNQCAVEIYMPEGTPLVKTALVADSLRTILSKDHRVKSITQFNGLSSPRFHITYAPKMPADNFAQFIVNTGSTDETASLLDEYTDVYAHYFPSAYVKFKQVDFQHVSTFEFRFYGEDTEELKNAAGRLMAKMRQMPELTNIRTDWGDPVPVMEVIPDPVVSSYVGASRTLTAANIALATQGFTLGSVNENNTIIPIVLKTDDKNGKTTLENLSNIYISTFIPTVTVPLRQIASVKPEWSEKNIIHRNGVRTITVTAEPKRGVISTKPLSSIQKMIDRKSFLPSLKASTIRLAGSLNIIRKT